MGYKKRDTKGRVDCRPPKYQEFLYPMPPTTCSKDCVYWPQCKEGKEIILPLKQREEKICQVLGMPNRIWSINQDGLRKLTLESDSGKEKRTFTGNTMLLTIRAAENWILNERKMGQL